MGGTAQEAELLLRDPSILPLKHKNINRAYYPDVLQDTKIGRQDFSRLEYFLRVPLRRKCCLLMDLRSLEIPTYNSLRLAERDPWGGGGCAISCLLSKAILARII